MTKMFTAVPPSPATANALSLTLGHQLFLKAKLKCGAFAWQKEGQLQAQALLPVEDEDSGICPGVTESARGLHYYTDTEPLPGCRLSGRGGGALQQR